MDDEDAQARSGNTHPDVAEAEHGGRNPTGARGGAEAATATRGRTKAEVATQLMEQVVERGNMWRAYERVLRNKGAPGADGMRVTDLKAWLQAHWPAVKAALLAGSYLPREVRAVDIPKPTGGVRTLGVPTVVDRLIQQAVLQVLQPIFEGGFSESSYGFADPDAMRGKRYKPPGTTSETAGFGWRTSILRNSSTESTTTCSWHAWQDESETPECSESSAASWKRD